MDRKVIMRISDIKESVSFELELLSSSLILPSQFFCWETKYIFRVPDWDLAVCLNYECRRKQLRKPIELDSWIDLRATYRVSPRKYICYCDKNIIIHFQDVNFLHAEQRLDNCPTL